MLLPTRYRTRLPVTAALTAAIVVLACGLRVWTAGGDLWLDEVWSIQLADQVTAPWEIATLVRSDNNHMLNTAYVAWLGANQPLLHYRLLSIVAGTLAVVVAGGIAAERGRLEQWTAMLMLATSFLMVHYASEARGYALLVLLALAAYWSLLRFLRQPQARYAVGFACCASAGFLAHPTFLYFYLATGYWSVTAVIAARHRGSDVIKTLLMLHGLPGVTLGLLYLTFVRHLELGGGPAYDVAEILAQAGSLAVGGPFAGSGAVLGAVVMLLAVVVSLWAVRHDDDTQSTTLALCLVLPLVAVLVTPTPFLFVRYFLVAIVFAQLLCAFGLARLYRQGRLGRWAFGVLLTLFVVANLTHVVSLGQTHRGHYRAALQYISDQDSSSRLSIGSNHDHGTSILLDFYRQRVSPPREIEYVRSGQWPEAGPNWLILHHDPSRGPCGYDETYVIGGETYNLSKVFDAAILSGWQWYCYRKAPQEALLADNSAPEMLNVVAAADR